MAASLPDMTLDKVRYNTKNAKKKVIISEVLLVYSALFCSLLCFATLCGSIVLYLFCTGSDN